MTNFIVYVMYCQGIEDMYGFTTLEAARAKQLDLSQKWARDSFDTYLVENCIADESITLETYDNYFMEVEDDVYVGVNEVIIEGEPNE